MRLLKSHQQKPILSQKTSRSVRQKNKGIRYGILVVLAVSLFSSFYSVIAPSSVSADSSTTTDLDKQITGNLYRNALYECILNSPLRDDNSVLSPRNRINEAHVLSFNWFTAAPTPLAVDTITGSILNSTYGSNAVTNEGDSKCADPVFIKEALKAIGYTIDTSDLASVFGIMCDLGFHRANSPNSQTNAACITSGSGDWSEPSDNKSTAAAKFLSSTSSKVTSLSDEAMYLLIYRTFKSVCSIKTGADQSVNVSKSTGVNVKTLAGDGTDASPYSMVSTFYTYGSDPLTWSEGTGVGSGISVGITSRSNVEMFNYFAKPNDSINIDGGIRKNTMMVGKPYYFNTGDDGQGLSCGQLGESANQYASAYLVWVNSHKVQAAQITASNTAAAAGTDKQSCTINGIGWIICPVLTLLSNISDGMFSFLADNFLRTNVDSLSTTGDNAGTYKAWSIMRNIADVAFVIAFLIIIFSQVTNIGVTNYGIKKLLPRLIISAILVNLSFFICQIAVDLSNILGYGLKGLFDGIGASVSVPGSGNVNGTGVSAWGNISVIVLALGAGYAAYAALGTLISVLLAALVAILVIFFLLILRQMLIILLIVIAPIAFVAFLLPNTESLFKKWRQIFTSLLLLYPIIGIVFGASALASKILTTVYGTTTGSNVIQQIIAQGVLVIPLIAVPFILKGSLNGVGQIGAKINNIGNKAGNAASKQGAKQFEGSRLGQFQKYRKGVKEQRGALIKSGAYKGSNKNPLNWGRNAGSRLNKGINDRSGKFGARLNAQGVDIADRADAEEISAAQKQIARSALSTTDAAAHGQSVLSNAIKKGDSIQARAAFSFLQSQGAPGIEASRAGIAENESLLANEKNPLGNSLRQHIQDKHSDIKNKDARLSGWATKSGSISDTGHLGGLTDAQIAGQTADSLQEGGGSISAERAKTILKDKLLTKDMKPNQLAVLESIKNGSWTQTPPPTGGVAPQTNGGPNGGGSSGRNGGTPVGNGPSSPSSAPSGSRAVFSQNTIPVQINTSSSQSPALSGSVNLSSQSLDQLNDFRNGTPSFNSPQNNTAPQINVTNATINTSGNMPTPRDVFGPNGSAQQAQSGSSAPVTRVVSSSDPANIPSFLTSSPNQTIEIQNATINTAPVQIQTPVQAVAREQDQNGTIPSVTIVPASTIPASDPTNIPAFITGTPNQTIQVDNATINTTAPMPTPRDIFGPSGSAQKKPDSDNK